METKELRASAKTTRLEGSFNGCIVRVAKNNNLLSKYERCNSDLILSVRLRELISSQQERTTLTKSTSSTFCR